MGMSDAKNLSVINILNRSPYKSLLQTVVIGKTPSPLLELVNFFLSDNKNYVTEHIYFFLWLPGSSETNVDLNYSNYIGLNLCFYVL